MYSKTNFELQIDDRVSRTTDC